MNPRAQKIEALRARLQQLEAAEKAAKARARVAASKQERAEDTRRKILLGAFVLERLQVAEVSSLELRGAMFGAWLARAGDRALFGLAAPPAGGAVAAPVATAHQPPEGER